MKESIEDLKQKLKILQIEYQKLKHQELQNKKLKELINKLNQLEKTLHGKTIDADKLIQLSKEVTNKFIIQ